MFKKLVERVEKANYHVHCCFMVRVILELKKRTSQLMKAYCTNKDGHCQKLVLFSDFDGCPTIAKGSCQCCGMCKDCTCGCSDNNLKCWVIIEFNNIITITIHKTKFAILCIMVKHPFL